MKDNHLIPQNIKDLVDRLNNNINESEEGYLVQRLVAIKDYLILEHNKYMNKQTKKRSTRMKF